MRRAFAGAGAAVAAMVGLLPSSAPAADVRIALAAPLTGRMAAQGLAMQAALASAVTDINAAGGVLGQKVVFDVEDDGCRRETAEGAAQAIVARGTRLVIGHPCSNAAVAASSIYAGSGVLFIAIGARHPDVTRTQAAAPLLRLAGRDDRQGQAAAHAPGRRVAIVQDRTAYARAVTEQTVAALKAAGFDPVAVLPIVAGKHAYSEAVSQLANLKAEAVFFAGFPDEGAVLLANLDAARLGCPFLGSDALATMDFASVAARTKRSVNVLLPAEPEPAAQGADRTSALIRGALEVWRDGAERAGSTDGVAIATEIKRAPSEVKTAALGRLSFDGAGDVASDGFTPASPRAGEWIVPRQTKTP
jgi:branched-chain amino acid transport system substrate-binding protein